MGVINLKSDSETYLHGRYKTVTSNDIRDTIFNETLLRIYVFLEYGGDTKILDDVYQSLMFLGPPGVGKSALQYIAATDVAKYISELRKDPIEVKKISMRITNEDAKTLAEQVVTGKVIPYLHIYLPQTKIWSLEGTPSPMDNYVNIAGVAIPVSLWRMDAYFLPFLDYVSEKLKTTKPEEIVKIVVPKFIVLDEFDKARKDVLQALYQLARAAELGRAKFCPFTIITLIGNTPETDAFGVKQLSGPLVDRSQVYIVSKPDVPGWLAYMNEIYGSKWATEVGAFLTLNPDAIYMQDQADPSTIQTPRGFTHIAVRIHVLKSMVANRVISKETYWKQVERIVYSTLIKETADELIAFLKGLHYVKLDEIIEKPELIATLDKNVAAYVIVKATSALAQSYIYEKDRAKKEGIIKKIAEMVKYGSKVLGLESLGLVLTSLPPPVRLSLAKHVDKELLSVASEAKKLADELEEMISGG